MAKPILLTKEMRKQAINDFEAMLYSDSVKLNDGKLTFSKNFACKKQDAIVNISMRAYRKITALVTTSSNEVGWHGTVSRVGINEFLIEDIFVYPQEVTKATVTTDQELYTTWLFDFDDDKFDAMRLHGHSHVNMGVTPSVTDVAHRNQILAQLKDDMFYIFMVWNKSLSTHTLIYDMQQNVLYENSDIEVVIEQDGDMEEFLADAEAKVKEYAPKISYKKYDSNSYYSNYYDQRGDSKWEF